MKTKRSPKQTLFLTLALFTAVHVSAFTHEDTLVYQRVEDPVYFGYEVAGGIVRYTIAAGPDLLRGMLVVHEGATIGVKVSNSRAMLKVQGGLFYSSAAVPRSVDLVTAGLSGGWYLLRTRQLKYRTFEPYALGGLGYRQARFFSRADETKGVNYSTGRAPELGKVGWLNASLGLGTEFQLENPRNQFLHFFLEARLGMPMVFQSKTAELKTVQTSQTVQLMLGFTVGKLREKRR